MFYNWHRYYDPSTGRYITSDPLGLEDGTNPYNYAYANALMYYDPYGLFVPPALPQGAVDFSAGLGDALLLGFGDDLRELADIDGVDECSNNYKYGGWASFAAGGARLGYAALAKGGSMLASSGVAASNFRNNLKIVFRGGVGRNWRKPDLSKYSNDAALRKAAGKTNGIINAYGFGVAAAGASNVSECGCE